MLLIAIVSFGAGVWYMGGFVMPEPTPIEEQDSTPRAQAVYENADTNRIRVDTPLPGAVVSSVFSVQGEARGGWYFEANFPYEVLDVNGALIAEGPVTAEGEWMTPEFVPFAFTVSIPGYVGPATLVLKNDNASGLPENAASVSIPIIIR